MFSYTATSLKCAYHSGLSDETLLVFLIYSTRAMRPVFLSFLGNQNVKM
jgi:hypothetical protein